MGGGRKARFTTEIRTSEDGVRTFSGGSRGYFITRAVILLRVLIYYYACGYFTTRAVILLDVLLFCNACGYFLSRELKVLCLIPCKKI